MGSIVDICEKVGGVAGEIKDDKGQDNMRRIESAATNAVKNLGKDEKSGKHTGATQVGSGVGEVCGEVWCLVMSGKRGLEYGCGRVEWGMEWWMAKSRLSVQGMMLEGCCWLRKGAGVGVW